MSRDADTSAWGMTCVACGATVDGALELRDAPCASTSIFETGSGSESDLQTQDSPSCFCCCDPCSCHSSQHLFLAIDACFCGHSLVDSRVRLQRVLSSLLSWAPPKPVPATLALVSAVESVTRVLPRHSAVAVRLVDACCLAILATLGADAKGMPIVSKLSWDAADTIAIIVGQPSVSEVLMRCRAVKAAAAAGDSDCVAAWGKSCVKLAGNVLGSDSEVLRLLRMWVSGVIILFCRYRIG
jgi:hypothetical protein